MDETIKHLKLPFHTPDLLALECAPLHLVMECGKINEELPVYCTAFTVEKMSLIVERNSQTAIPVRLPSVHKARVAGSLYALTTAQVIALDKAKRNRLWFERKLTPVYVPCGNDEITVLPKPVWLHHGISDYWNAEGVQWDLTFNRGKGSYSLAKTYVDNCSLLNNHFRFSPAKVEDNNPPPASAFATDAVYKHVTLKNRQETGFFRKLKRRFFGLPEGKFEIKGDVKGR